MVTEEAVKKQIFVFLIGSKYFHLLHNFNLHLKMNKILLALLILISVGSISCKKCVTCSYNAVGVNPYSGEYCSSKQKDIDFFKKTVNTEAQGYGTSATCVDK